MELPPADLGPTGSLTQTLSLLREVLASHDSSVVPLDARQADFAQVSFNVMANNMSLSFNKCPTILITVQRYYSHIIWLFCARLPGAVLHLGSPSAVVHCVSQ